MNYGGGRRRGCCLVHWKSGEVFAEELVGFLEDLLERFQRNLNRYSSQFKNKAHRPFYHSTLGLRVIKKNRQRVASRSHFYLSVVRRVRSTQAVY